MFHVPVAVSVKSTGLTQKGLVLGRKVMKHVIRHGDARRMEPGLTAITEDACFSVTAVHQAHPTWICLQM